MGGGTHELTRLNPTYSLYRLSRLIVSVCCVQRIGLPRARTPRVRRAKRRGVTRPGGAQFQSGAVGQIQQGGAPLPLQYRRGREGRIPEGGAFLPLPHARVGASRRCDERLSIVLARVWWTRKRLLRLRVSCCPRFLNSRCVCMYLYLYLYIHICM